MSKFVLGFLVLAAIVGFWGVRSYNKLVSMDQAVQAQWSQVENVYQRRADLVPNLVETVKGAAKFEKDTFTAVTEARAKVGQVQGNTSPNDAASVEKFRAAQDQLSSALSKLMETLAALEVSIASATSAIAGLAAERHREEKEIVDESSPKWRRQTLPG